MAVSFRQRGRGCQAVSLEMGKVPQDGTLYRMLPVGCGQRPMRRTLRKAMRDARCRLLGLESTKKVRPTRVDPDTTFTVMETAVICLHTGSPLFPNVPTLRVNNEWLREQLIRALLDALDRLRQEGAEVAETPLLARFRRAYTSELSRPDTSGIWCRRTFRRSRCTWQRHDRPL